MNSPENNSRVSRVQRHQKQKFTKHKKTESSYLKILGIFISIVIIIYLIINCSSIFSTTVYAEPLPNANNTVQQLNGSSPVYKNYSPDNMNTVSGYMTEQAHLLKNINRFDINTALSMNYYDIVNLYPDSLNSASAFQNNFLKFSSILSTTERASEEQLVNEIVADNSSFVNSVINYNNLLRVGGASYAEIMSAKASVQSKFNTITTLINQNIDLF